jgi:biopolymer transport protein ExbD
MARPKLPRKSTTVDMTAMCDVAFLLLTFFILTTKFKPSEVISITTPNSVSAKVAPEKDVTLISIDKEGKAYLSLDNENVKGAMAREMNETGGAGLSDQDIELFKKASFFATPISQVKSYLAIPEEDRKANALPGIPIADTANNEMIKWIQYVVSAHSKENEKLNLIIKGDNLVKYPQFKNVIDAFKKNDQFKFQMITNPEGVPEGTDLWKRFMKGEKINTD